MTNNTTHTGRKDKFFREYEETSPALTLGLIIVSLGLYVINWIYVKNRNFEKIFEESPDSKRGLVILMILPFSWFFIMFILKSIIFSELPLLIGIFEIVVWGLILFLIYKYLWDFCEVFGKISQSRSVLWFSFFVLGGIGIISLLLKFMYLVPLVFFLAIVIPAMETELNVNFKSITIRKKHDNYYSR